MTLPPAAKRAGRRSLAAVVRGVWGSLLLTGSLSSAGHAQDAARDTPTRPPGELQVFLMTFGPGREVWERFGHNAVWIHDPADSSDIAYNYGLFDFHQHNFILRFVRGQMWYWMAGFPTSAYIAQYERDNRSIWVQELELPPRAKVQLQEFLRWNAEPEHRYYHYDYYRDNCSTRVRDAIDRVLNGTLRRQTETIPAGTTYRFHTQRLVANDPPIYTGLMAALGPGVDRPISAWEEMFLPLKMRDWVRTVSVSGPDGRAVPLVRSERTIFKSSAEPPPEAPPFWVPWYLLIGTGIGAWALLLAGSVRTSAAARYGFLALAAGWVALAGLAGLVLAGLWGLTDHVMAYRNENLLQLDPLALLLVPVLFAVARGEQKDRRGERLAAVVAGLSLLGLGLRFLPGFHQVNGPIVALALPANIGIATALVRLARTPSKA